MPKSKRNKVVSLTKVKKKGMEPKDKLIEKIREHAGKFAFCYSVVLENERNAFIKDLRADLRPGVLVCAKNKVMQVALGMHRTVECQEGINKIAQSLTHGAALLFTDAGQEAVEALFDRHQPEGYARPGQPATRTVTLESGTDALSAFPHSMESRLRTLGLPTLLKNGVIHLMGAYTVCTEGDQLAPEQVQLLKLLEEKMSSFSVAATSVWCKEDGSFKSLLEEDENMED